MKNELTIKKASQNFFSIKARLKSFQYAFEGLNSFFSTQHNAIIHLIMTLLAFSAAVFYNVTKVEAIAIALAIGFVWTAELFKASRLALSWCRRLGTADHSNAIAPAI